MLTKRLNVHLYVTPICNLQCKHCYYDSLPLGSNVPDLLPITQIAGYIVDLSDAYDAQFEVEGGEIFCRKDVGALFSHVPAAYWRNITFTTNGTSQIPFDVRNLRLLGDLRVSVEGHTDELQRELRRIPLGPVLRTCELLQLHKPVTLRITLHKKNYDCLPQMISHFVGLGFRRFSFFEFQATGRGYCYQDEYCLDAAQMEQVLSGLCSQPVQDGIDLLKVSLKAGRVPLVTRMRSRLESAGYHIAEVSGIPSLTINYNGTLGICPWKVGRESLSAMRASCLISDVDRFLESGLLDHSCEYCSAIAIRYQRT